MTTRNQPRLILNGGSIVDGTGSAPYVADLLVEDGRIAAIGRSEDWAPDGVATVIDCAGRIVAPGFVDIHTHSDLSLLAYPDNESRVTQGITTELLGNCGMTPAPTGGDPDGVANVIGTIDVVPSVERRWNTFGEWVATLASAGAATNAGALVGHGTARFVAAGPQARALDSSELDAVDSELAAALGAGAFGASLGLMYAPGEAADHHELVRVAERIAAADGLLSVHMRNYQTENLERSVREVLDVARATNVRLQLSHFRSVGPGDGFNKALELVEQARAHVDVAADVYPYINGHTNLIQILPPSIRGLGPTGVTALCRKDLGEVARLLAARGFSPELILVMKAPKTPEAVGVRVSDVSSDPWLWLAHLLLDNDSLVDVSIAAGRWDVVDLALREPWVSIASDGAALSHQHALSKPHPRSWGAFPAAYRRMRGLGVSTAEAVRRMTDLPASRIGLNRTLRQHAPGDLVVFDEKTIDSAATDLDPATRATGIDTVIVNGTPVLRNGVLTGTGAGRILRRGDER